MIVGHRAISLFLLWMVGLVCHPQVAYSQTQGQGGDHSSVFSSILGWAHYLELFIAMFVVLIIIVIRHTVKGGYRELGQIVKSGIDDLGSKISGVTSTGIADLGEKTEKAITSGMADGYSSLLSQLTPLVDKWKTVPETIEQKLNGLTRRVLSYYQKTSDTGLQDEINDIEDLLYESKFVEAEPRINRIVAQHPQNEDVYILCSKYFAARALFDEAQRQLEVAKEINPQNGEIFFTAAQNKIAQNDYQTAETRCQEAVSLNPKDPRYLLSLGFVKWKLGKLSDAINYTEEARQVEANDPRTKMLIYNNLAYYLAQRGEDGDIDSALDYAKDLPGLLGEVTNRKPAGDKQNQTLAWVYLRMYELKDEKKLEWLLQAIKYSNTALKINDQNKFALDTLIRATTQWEQHQADADSS